MMITWLVCVPLAALLLVIIFRDAVAYMRCKYYESQGFIMRYRPVLGFITLFLPSKDKRDQADVLNPIRRVMGGCKGKPGLVINDWFKMKAYIWLTDYNLVKELFVKEIQCTHRFRRFENERIPFDFFFSNSEKSLHQRGNFAELFRIEHLDEVSHMIVSSWKTILKQELKDKKISEAPRFVEFPKLLKDALFDTANKILFGPEHPVPVVEETGQEITRAVYDFYSKLNTDKGEFSLANILSFGLLSKYDLTMVFVEATKEAKRIKGAIIGLFESRMKLDDSKLGNNVIDIMVKTNRKAEGPKFTNEDIVAYMSIFLFAGSDTTSKTLMSVVYRLGLYPEIANKIREEVLEFGLDKGSVTLAELDQSKTLDRFFREILRVYGPAPFLFERVATCDFTLGKYTIKKGDLINVPITYFQTDSTGSDGVANFDPNLVLKPEETKSPAQAYIPFSTGRRSCPGKFLAEMTTKIVIVHLVKHVKLETDENKYPAYFKMAEGIGLDTCTVKCTVIEPLD